MNLTERDNAPEPRRRETPTWPMLNRTQEQLLQTVWALQQERGWCFASQRYLGECVGVSRRHVRRLVNELVPRYLKARNRTRGETLLLRTWPPRAERGEFGPRQGRTFMSGGDRTFVSGGVGHLCPPIGDLNTPNGSIGGHPPRKPAPTPSPADAAKAPLFVPQRVNLWAQWGEHKRARPTLTLPELLKDLFGQGIVCRVRFRDRTYAISSVDVAGFASTQQAVVCLPHPNGVNVHTARWGEEDLLKLEFFP